MVYMHNENSAIKKNEIMSWMDIEIIILNEVRERQISYDIIYMWNQKKKKIQMNSFLKQRLADIEKKLTVTDGKRGMEEG